MYHEQFLLDMPLSLLNINLGKGQPIVLNHNKQPECTKTAICLRFLMFVDKCMIHTVVQPNMASFGCHSR